MAYDDETVWPQDLATGLQDTIDWNDAGGFAWLVHNPNATDYVVEGFSFSVDWANDILNITGGIAMIEVASTQTNDHTADDGPPAKQLEKASFRVQRGPSGDINLNSGVNHVWVAFDPTANDAVSFHVNTDGTVPSNPYVKIGTVDTSTQTTSRANPAPTASFTGTLVTPEGS